MATTYTATPEMCHTELNYSENLLPHDWPGRKFRFRLDDDRRVSLVEGHSDASILSWVVSQELAEKIKASVETEEVESAEIEEVKPDIEQELRDELQRLRDVITAKEVEFRTFKRRVGEIAMEYAERHDWCSTVQEALDDIGIEVPKKEYMFTLSVTYRVRGTKETYGEPDSYDLQRCLDLDPDVTVTLGEWDDLEVEYVQHDVMDVEEVEE